MVRAIREGSMENMDLEPDLEEKSVGLDEERMRGHSR